MPRAITAEDIHAYREHGLVCLRGMLDRDWVERLREAVALVPGGYVDRSFIWPFNGTFRELVFDSPVGEIAATLMGSKTCGLQIDNILVKEPHAPHRTPWHHDQPYYQVQGTQLCGMWIGLDETTLENGGLEWIRGSHKWGEMFEPDS
ncbi:MAG: phytanoyl-CoA dioxygenase family protein, partial [Chloroflexi bacterium]|nr:phytanoyl-CoA dioxygenase family protein [Chloroflexota bacterium]